VISLKEQMARDAKAFFNPKEFGEAMHIDGVSCLGSWQQEQDEPIKQFFGSGMDVPGVYTQDRVLFAICSDGTAMPLPVPDEELDIDGKIWTVRDALSEGNVVKLVLYRNES